MDIGPRKKDIVGSILVIALFVLVCFVTSRQGYSHRLYADHNPAKVIAAPEDALAEWKEAEVKGRILILTDRYLNAEIQGIGNPSEIPPVAKENYMYVAFRANIVRMVYHIIPEEAWPEVERIISPVPGVSRSAKAFRMVLWDIPIIITRARDIPFISEEVLLHIGGHHYSEEELRRIIAMLHNGSLKSDFITLTGDFPGNTREEIINYASSENR